MMNKKKKMRKKSKKTPSNVCRLKLTETLKKHASEKLATEDEEKRSQRTNFNKKLNY